MGSPRFWVARSSSSTCLRLVTPFSSSVSYPFSHPSPANRRAAITLLPAALNLSRGRTRPSLSKAFCSAMSACVCVVGTARPVFKLCKKLLRSFSCFGASSRASLIETTLKFPKPPKPPSSPSSKFKLSPDCLPVETMTSSKTSSSSPPESSKYAWSVWRSHVFMRCTSLANCRAPLRRTRAATTSPPSVVCTPLARSPSESYPSPSLSRGVSLPTLLTSFSSSFACCAASFSSRSLFSSEVSNPKLNANTASNTSGNRKCPTNIQAVK